jgi:GTP-binding protein HflX
MLPRLSGLWTHLEQKEESGCGPEDQTDRRIVRDRIALLKDKIKTIDKQMNATRQSWRDGSCGSGRIYQCGKSTLMNAG